MGRAAVKGVSVPFNQQTGKDVQVGVLAPGARLWWNWSLAPWGQVVLSAGMAIPMTRYAFWLPPRSPSTDEPLYRLGRVSYSAGIGFVAVVSP